MKAEGKETKVYEKTNEFLKYEFSADEIKQMSVDMAQATIRAESLEDKKKAINSDFKGQIDAERLQANSLAVKIRDGHEYRNTDCKKELNFETGMVTIIRIDTGEEVAVRKMNAGERQMTITGFLDSTKQQ